MEWYNINQDLYKVLIPKLKEFREKVKSYPQRYTTLEAWHQDLEEMIWCLEAAQRDEVSDRVRRGLELFGRSLPDLWD